MSQSITKFLKIAVGLIVVVFLLLFIIGVMLPAPKSTNSTTAQTLTDATVQDKKWINDTANNLKMVQQIDTTYQNECERDGATYLSKYNKAVDVENAAMQAAGISQQATVSPDLQEIKANYENYLTYLRLYAAWKKKAWSSMNSEGVNTQAMEYGESGQEEEETANKYLDSYNSGMSEYLKSHRI